jgi:hypothetical protein
MYETLHMWTQVVGKIRLAHSPAINHWRQVALYVTPSGLTTFPIPYGARTIEILFDFIYYDLMVHTSGKSSYHDDIHRAKTIHRQRPCRKTC